ncbi:MAG: DUF5658 family protein [Candidatus Omnitrophota bacterium]|nr:DUF5658 family protein [Candidatus Omnitrophota bacterium]
MSNLSLMRRAMLMLMLSAAPAFAQDAPPHRHGIAEKVDLTALVVAAGADLGSTERCLGAGTCRELNPLLSLAVTKNAMFFGATKMAITALVGWIVHELYAHGHPKIARALAWSSSGLWTTAAVRNARFSQESQP